MDQMMSISVSQNRQDFTKPLVVHYVLLEAQVWNLLCYHHNIIIAIIGIIIVIVV